MTGKERAELKNLRFAVLATDVVLFTVRDGELLVRLIDITRDRHFPTGIGLPGGLMRPHEIGRDSAQRHLHYKGGITPDEVYMEQLFTFSKVNRDPNGRVVAMAYLALVPWDGLRKEEKDDTVKFWWTPVSRAKKLAYDHDDMLTMALERLRLRIASTNLVGKLMPKEFTLTELEKMYEVVLAKKLDKRNFRKKILKLKMLKALPHKRRGGRFRPAQLYKFASADNKELGLPALLQ